MKYLSLLWMRGLVRAEGEEENAPEGRGGEGKEDTYQLGLASSLELSYLKWGDGCLTRLVLLNPKTGIEKWVNILRE